MSRPQSLSENESDILDWYATKRKPLTKTTNCPGQITDRGLIRKSFRKLVRKVTPDFLLKKHQKHRDH